MDCPHCRDKISPFFTSTPVRIDKSDDPKKYSILYSAVCPACHDLIIYNKFVDRPVNLISSHIFTTKEFEKIDDTELLVPKTKKAKEFPPDSGIPPHYIEDYKEAYAVLEISPNASAALSRRLLQKLLREKAGVKPSNLDSEIKEAKQLHQYPSYIKDVINNVKSIGEYGAHPNMTAADQIIDVEPEEAQWSLNVLELLFEFHFIGPEKVRRMQNAISKKGSNPKKYNDPNKNKNNKSSSEGGGAPSAPLHQEEK